MPKSTGSRPLLEAANAEVDRITPLLEAAQAEVDRLTPLLEAANAEVDRITPLLEAAQAEVDRLTPLLEAANAEIERLQGELDTARQTPQRVAIANAIAALNDALANVDASATDAEVTAADEALAAARQAIADANYLPADETAARTADVDTIAGNLATAKATRVTSLAAATKETEIATEAAQTTDAGLGGSDAPTTTDGSAGEYTLAIAHGDVSITVEGATDDADEKFESMDLGGGSTMHTRTMDADADGNVMTEVAIVTTDIEAPKATPFADVHTLDARADGETVNDEMPADALNVVGAKLRHVKASMFVAPAGTVGSTHPPLPARGVGRPQHGGQ